jgi:hypothetical protein
MKSSLNGLIPFFPFLLSYLRLPSSELDPILDNSNVKIKVKLRLTVGQSVRKSWCHYCLTVTVLFLWGTLSDERTGSVFCICCCPLPAQSSSGPSPLVLETIFYCLRFVQLKRLSLSLYNPSARATQKT